HRLRLDAVAHRRVDDDELATDAPRLFQEGLALVFVEMAVEMSGEDAMEDVVGKGQRESVSLDERCSRDPPACELEHRRALVEGDHRSREILGQEAGAAGDIE